MCVIDNNVGTEVVHVFQQWFVLDGVCVCVCVCERRRTRLPRAIVFATFVLPTCVVPVGKLHVFPAEVWLFYISTLASSSVSPWAEWWSAWWFVGGGGVCLSDAGANGRY